jgi:uncharacterized protein YjbI with pentapeptide repeats
VFQHACHAGLALFDAVHAEQSDLRRRQGKTPRMGKIRIPWTALSYVWLSLSGFSRWLFEHRLVPMPNLARVDLRGVNLFGADLDGVNLRGVNLSGVNLRGVNLSGVNLSGVNLSGANLGDWERGPDGYARRKAVSV